MALRMTLNLSDPYEEAVNRLAEEQGTTLTDIIRKAVAMYVIVHDRAIKQGEELSFVKDGLATPVILLEFPPPTQGV